MLSLLKGQIIKPFLMFTKNLSTDQIHLSFMKGEGRLNNLELNENTLMSLLNLPTWLNLRKASCSNISFKIRWTKIETCPVLVVIDQVDVELEASEVPRPEMDLLFASYRTGSGKYRLADKVVDGATVLINSVCVRFIAPAFQASIEVSRVSVVSKTPSWKNGPLNLTSLSLPSADALLIFKQLSWDSVRIVADGLLSELSGIPVKLITNGGRLRLTLKKRLSDSSLISTRVHFLLDDLLWVLTISQVEACIVFLRSLQHSITLSIEQSKRLAASRVKCQTMSWRNALSSSLSASSADQLVGSQVKHRSAAARIFHHYDVVETSYHFCVLRTEIHFCDERKSGINPISIPNGYIRVHVYGVEFDWYPYHLAVSPQIRWCGCEDFQEARDAWLNCNNAYLKQMQLWHAHRKAFDSYMSDKMPAHNFNPPLILAVSVFRVADFDVSLVSFPNTSCDEKVGPSPADTFSEEVPLQANLFIGSDKKLHCLPANTYLLTIEHWNAYCPSTDSTESSDSNMHEICKCELLPCLVFGQMKPLYVRFDMDTVIWLNTFLLTLQLHLDVFLKYQVLWAIGEKSNVPKCYHLRCEALMPRIVLPLNSSRSFRHLPNVSEHEGRIPDALVIQADELTIQLLIPPISSPYATALSRLVDSFPFPTNFDDKRSSGRGLHVRVDETRFTRLLSQTRANLVNVDDSTWFCCVHCPYLWMDFLSVSNIRELEAQSSITDSHHTKEPVYRQPFLNPVPLTLWVAVSTDLSPNRPFIETIVDFDNVFSPLDPHNRSNQLNASPSPITFHFGALPTIDMKYPSVSLSQSSFLASSQFSSFYTLFRQFSCVLDQLTFDTLRIVNLKTDASIDNPSTNRIWFTLCLKLSRCVELHLHDADDGQTSQHDSTSQELHPCDTCTQTPFDSLVAFPSHQLGVSQRSPLQATLSDEWMKSIEQCSITPTSRINSMLSMDGSSDNASVAGSQDDWINTYQVLFALDDSTSASCDVVALNDSTAALTAHLEPSACPVLSSEETGVDVIKMYPPFDPSTNQQDADVSIFQKQPNQKISYMDRNFSSRSSFCVRLHHVVIAADGSNNDFRMWLDLRNLEVLHSNSSQFAKIVPYDESVVFHTKLTENPLWSIFLGSTTRVVKIDSAEQYLESVLFVKADLLSDWSLNLSSPIRHAITVLANHFVRNSPSGHSSPIDQDRIIPYVKSTAPVVDLTIHLKGGCICVDFGLDEKKGNDPPSVMKIRLQQGLFIAMDRDFTIQLGHNLYSDQFSPPNVQRKTSSIVPVRESDVTVSDQQAVCVRHRNERERLESKIQKLTSELAQLRSELDRIRSRCTAHPRTH